MINPSPLATLVVAGLFVVAGFVVLARSGVISEFARQWWVSLATWVIAIAFLGRSIGEFRYLGFFKKVRGTRFARLDSMLYSPVAFILGLGTAIVAHGK